jgi:hypothetical protein
VTPKGDEEISNAADENDTAKPLAPGSTHGDEKLNCASDDEEDGQPEPRRRVQAST